MWHGEMGSRQNTVTKICKLAGVFTVLPPLLNVDTIAKGRGIRELRRLERLYGKGNWLKKKGMARVRIESGAVLKAEIHWYEAHGIGKVEHKIKRYL